MGMYDTIKVPCPECEEIYEAQSKSGECILAVYTLDETPNDVLQDVNRHAPFTCYSCDAVFEVKWNGGDIRPFVV